MSTPNGGVTRRSFLLSMAGTVLGVYVMPTKGFEALSAEETAETVRELFQPPTKHYIGDNYFVVWMENLESGPDWMIWEPETEQESADAQRFYDCTF